MADEKPLLTILGEGDEKLTVGQTQKGQQRHKRDDQSLGHQSCNGSASYCEESLWPRTLGPGLPSAARANLGGA